MTDTLGRRHDRTYSIPTAGVWTGPTLTAASPDNGGAASSLTASLRSGEYQIGVNAVDIEGYPAKIELYRDATFALGYTRRVDVAGRLVSRFDRSQLPIASAATDTFLDTPRFENQRVIYDPRTSRTRPQFVESSLAAGSYGSYDGITGAYDTELDASGLGGFGGGAAYPAQYDYTRDAGGRVLIERHRMCTSCTLPGVEDVPTSRTSLYATSYTYRADGRIGSVNNADGAHTYTYDARGQVSTLTAAEGTYGFTYDEMGRNIGLSYPDGHTRSQRYDELGRLRERCYEYPSAPTRCYSASYDPVGNIVSLTDPEGTDTITVDALDRITRVTRAGAPDEDYTYNALGALTHNGTTALSTERPRLDGAGTAASAVPATLHGQPITLDLGGRVTTLGTAALRWTNTSVLRDVTESGATTNFAIDAFHRRIWKSAGGVTELYLYEGANRIATAATKVNPAPAEPSVYRRDRWLYEGIDHPLRVVHETDDHLSILTAYFELDLAGNVRRLRAEGGADLGGYRYSAFGKTLENTVVDAAFSDQPLRWKGRWHYTFGGVEVYDMRARQWCPELGVFLSVDEYVYRDESSTLWGWPNQNPIRWPDPTGHAAGDSYGSVNQAAAAAMEDYQLLSIAENREYGTIIYKSANGSYSYLAAITNGDAFAIQLAPLVSLVPNGATVVGSFHTHTADPMSDAEYISDRDKRSARRAAQMWPGFKTFVGTPHGFLKVFNPRTEATLSARVCGSSTAGWDITTGRNR